MSRTFRNILQHELIGLSCDVVAASNKCNVGTHGRIVDETQKTIVLRDRENDYRIAKKSSEFVINLDGRMVRMDGNAILGRPEDRIKKKSRLW
ncbi:MAG: ribonuclease P protein subunit [Candidatus Aenigmatarchaeota archaeon]